MSHFDLGQNLASLAIHNDFTEILSKVCYKLGTSLSAFSLDPVYNSDMYTKYGTLDLSSLSVFEDSPEGNTLYDDVVAQRDADLRSMMVNYSGLDLTSRDIRRSLFFNYLLSCAVCYVEVPKFVTKEGVPVQTYDKFFATRNPFLMSAWTGGQVSTMNYKTAEKISMVAGDVVAGDIRLVKLTNTAKDGNKISVPRSPLSTKDMYCIPLFMTYAYMSGLMQHLNSSILKFTYLKDNGTVRELCTTLNRDILFDYYKDAEYVDKLINCTDIFRLSQGGMKMGTKQSRGYVKVPELGLSRFDATGVRALNVARILSVEVVEEVDRSYIDVDLTSVIPYFNDAIDKLAVRDPACISHVIASLSLENIPTDNLATTLDAIKSTVKLNHTYLTTSYERQIHGYLISNPSLFPDYTGKPVIFAESSTNYGVEESDF